MTGNLPHSSIIRDHMRGYLNDVSGEISKLNRRMLRDTEFAGIFKNSVAAVSVLGKLARGQPGSLLIAAATTVRRCPFLIATGQMQLAHVDLRRFVEAMGKFPYFAEHPVEWSHLLTNPTLGIARGDEDPITWCANREQRWYIDYIEARFPNDRSGLIEIAVRDLGTVYRELSPHAHSTLESSTASSVRPTLRAPTTKQLVRYRETQRRAYSASVIVALAPKPSLLNRLTAIERAWFEWLIGKNASKAILGGAFLRE